MPVQGNVPGPDFYPAATDVPGKTEAGEVEGLDQTDVAEAGDVKPGVTPRSDSFNKSKDQKSGLTSDLTKLSNLPGGKDSPLAQKALKAMASLPPEVQNVLGQTAKELATNPAMLNEFNENPQQFVTDVVNGKIKLPSPTSETSAGLSAPTTPQTHGLGESFSHLDAGAPLDESAAAEGAQPPPADLGGVLNANTDIEALCFVVLSGAMNDSQEDLKMIMAEVKANTAAKQQLRNEIDKLSTYYSSLASKKPYDLVNVSDVQNAFQVPGLPNGANGWDGDSPPIPNADPNSSTGYTWSTAPNLALVEDQNNKGKVSVQSVNSLVQGMKDNLDSLSDVSQTQSLRMQMAMDRYSKLTETLSNILKKIDTTDEAVVANLK